MPVPIENSGFSSQNTQDIFVQPLQSFAGYIYLALFMIIVFLEMSAQGLRRLTERIG